MARSEKYIPALSFDWLTPLYDPVVKWLMPESKFKSRLIGRARIGAGHRVRDVGCAAEVAQLIERTE